MSYMIRNSSTCLMLLFIVPAAYADSAAPSDSDPKELSVAPLDHIEYPDDRPEWLNSSLGITKDTVRIVVVSGPCDSPEESLEELSLMQRAAVSTYISELTGSGAQYDFYPISDEEIDHEMVLRRYEGKVTQGDTTKYEHAVELCFTDEKRQEIKSSWQNVEVRDRLGALGVMTFGGLMMLMCSSALLGVFSRRVERRDR